MRNEAVQKFVSTRQGLLTASLVREFLSFFNMQFTMSIFEPESFEGVSYMPLNRDKLSAELGLGSDPDKPLLQTLLGRVYQCSEETATNATFVTLKNDAQVTKSNDNNLNNLKSPILLKSSADGDIVNGEDYDEDFQSSTTSPEPKNPESRAPGEANDASIVNDEVDESTSDLLLSQGSNPDNNTADNSVSHSSISADYELKV
jgi:FGFR1 oncogene partner